MTEAGNIKTGVILASRNYQTSIFMIEPIATI